MLGPILAMIVALEPVSSADAAELHAQRATVLWAERDLEGAEQELAAAYALDPIPKYLYGLGSIAEDRGDCPRAIDYFERFLQQLPDEKLTDESKRGEIESDAKRRIEACGGSRSESEPPPEPPPPEPPPPAAAPPRIDAHQDVRPWHRDPAGGTLLGLGSVAVATGSGLLIAAAVTDQRLPESDSATDFVASRDRSRALGTAGIVTISVGAALVVGAVIRYAVVARRHPRGRGVAFRF